MIPADQPWSLHRTIYCQRANGSSRPHILGPAGGWGPGWERGWQERGRHAGAGTGDTSPNSAAPSHVSPAPALTDLLQPLREPRRQYGREVEQEGLLSQLPQGGHKPAGGRARAHHATRPGTSGCVPQPSRQRQPGRVGGTPSQGPSALLWRPHHHDPPCTKLCSPPLTGHCRCR